MLKNIIFLFLLTYTMAVAVPAFAVDATDFKGGIERARNVATTNGLTGEKSAKDILQSITKWLLALVGTIAAISLVYGGYLYITSQGDENKAEKAKSVILYSIIGIIVIGLSAVIVNVVINVATR